MSDKQNRPPDTYHWGETMPQYAVLGIGVEAWVDLTQQEKPRQDGRRLSDTVILKRSTFDVVMRVLREVRRRDLRD